MQEFTNDALDLDLLPKYEEISLTSLNSKYWNVILINIGIFLLLIGLGIAALLIFNYNVRPYLYIITGFYIGFAVLITYLNSIGFKRRGFAVREKDILYRSGIIAISTTIVPFSRIQHISLHQGLFSRVYHLGEIRIFTAGGSSGSLHIPGIGIEHAKSIKEMLMKQINEIEA